MSNYYISKCCGAEVSYEFKVLEGQIIPTYIICNKCGKETKAEAVIDNLKSNI